MCLLSNFYSSCPCLRVDFRRILLPTTPAVNVLVSKNGVFGKVFLSVRSFHSKSLASLFLVHFINPAPVQIKTDAVGGAGLDKNTAGLAASLSAHFHLVEPNIEFQF